MVTQIDVFLKHKISGFYQIKRKYLTIDWYNALSGGRKCYTLKKKTYLNIYNTFAHINFIFSELSVLF